MDSHFSRRALLMGMTAMSAAATPLALAGRYQEDDPIFALCQSWREADAAYEAARLACQEKETALLGRLDYPYVQVFHEGSPRHAFTAAEIDSLMEDPSDWARRERLKARLALRQALWDRESNACGLTAAMAHEDAMSFRVDDAVMAVADMPAASFAGVAAKLALAVEIEGVSQEDSLDFPWPYLFSALADLRRLVSTQ
jgi:hypothetical protein